MNENQEIHDSMKHGAVAGLEDGMRRNSQDPRLHGVVLEEIKHVITKPSDDLIKRSESLIRMIFDRDYNNQIQTDEQKADIEMQAVILKLLIVAAEAAQLRLSSLLNEYELRQLSHRLEKVENLLNVPSQQ